MARARELSAVGQDAVSTSGSRELALHQIELSDAGTVLETGCVYIVELEERLKLPADLAAATNPKSSTGRLDVFTRVIGDRVASFDALPAGYEGPLYLEVSPRTFPILVRRGSRLAQIRFRRGTAKLDGNALAALHAREQLVDDGERRSRAAVRSRSASISPGITPASLDFAPSGTPV